MDKRKYKTFCVYLGTIAVVVLFLTNFEKILGIVSNILGILTPFTSGIIVAYVVNIPYSWLYGSVFSFLGTGNSFKNKLRKPLALILSFLIFAGIIVFVICIIVPEISNSINMLSNNIDEYIDQANTWIKQGLSLIGYEYSDTSDLLKPLNDLATFIGGHTLPDLLKSIFPHIYDITKNITMAVYNIFISVIVSVYFLAYKETLLNQMKKLLCAFIKDKQLKYVIKVGRTANEMIGRFVCGKVIDSFIIGVLCFIGLSIFGFDYAGLIAIIIGIANVVPFFGPIIGAIPCIVLLLLINPIEAFWFLLFILLLQQFDSNIVEPKILGETVGIDGFWIIFGVLLGGGLFGFIGMVLGVPILAVIYIFLGDHVNVTLKKKNYTVNNHTIDLNGEIVKTSHEDKKSIFADFFSGKKGLADIKKEMTKFGKNDTEDSGKQN